MKKRPKKLRLLIELEYDGEKMHGEDKEAMDWFLGDILKGDHLMLIDAGDLGDEIGQVKVLEIAPK